LSAIIPVSELEKNPERSIRPAKMAKRSPSGASFKRYVSTSVFKVIVEKKHVCRNPDLKLA